MRLFFTLLIGLLFSFCFVKTIHADENFDISAKTTYTISEENPTIVVQQISILNKKEFIFTPSYNISFSFENIKDMQVYNAAGPIPFEQETKNGIVTFKINFPNPPKGINSVNNFTVNFQTDEIIDKKGDVYEVDIPGISNPESFTDYQTEIHVPESFGKPSLIKPNISKNDLVFSKDETKGAGVVLIFGDAQYYTLDLTYNISNPNLFPIITEIALPPNTNYQTSLIQELSEKPKNTKIDTDGNWLAQYTLFPREEKIIHAKVLIKLDTVLQKVSLSHEEKNLYTKANKFWEANDSEVKKIAHDLKTPEKIYQYVVDTLSYNYDRISSGDDRFGGKGALANKENAVCMEYADLFVTLARSAGIPARTVEGYAYTKNSKLRPLSLIEDVLHAWAEYYDSEKKTWVMVDPTWGSTTNGIDYFHNLDLDHITFVIKGEESTYPIPAGGYKFEQDSKDILVAFSTEKDFIERESIEIIETIPQFSFSGIPISGFITIKNTGNTALINKPVLVTNANTGEEKEYVIKNLPPYGEESFRVSFETPFLTNTTHLITIQMDDFIHEAKVHVSLIPDLGLIVIGGGIFAAATIISIITYKTGRIYLQRRKRKNNIHRKSKKS